MTREQAENLLIELRTREVAAAAGRLDEWDHAWFYMASLADYQADALKFLRELRK